MRVAFLGLGRMGRPMARRLVEAGHEVTVWNRTPAKAEGFPRLAASPQEAVAEAEVVITMLADPGAVHAVLYETGLKDALPEGCVLVEMSTIGPVLARLVHADTPRPVLDAPVGGGVAQAEAGELVVLVGGEEETLERVRGVLEALGEVVRCGGPGAGQAMKMAFNAVLAVAMAAIGEAVALGERWGLDVATMVEVLRRGGAGPMAARKGPMLVSRRYEPSFALSLMCKDLRLIQQAAAEVNLAVPFASLAANYYRLAEGRGRGGEDYAAVAEVFREAARG